MAIARGEYTITELYDGENFYRAWADTPDGSGNSFSTTESDRLYIGTYVGLTRPSSPSQYTWSKIVGESAVIGALSNDTHQIGTNRDGEEGNYHGANTTLTILRGGIEETNDWNITLNIQPENSIEGTFSNHTYTVTKLKTDEATITFTAEHKTRKNDSLITKVFSLSKNKQGIDGKDAKSYFLNFNDTSIKKNRVTNEIFPENLVIEGYSITGEADPVPTSGYFKVFTQSEISVGRDEYEQAYVNELLDPEEYYVLSENNYPLILAYESKEAEDELIYGVTQLIELMSVKVYWYKDPEFKHLLDVQTVLITSDGIDGVSITGFEEHYKRTNSDTIPVIDDSWDDKPVNPTKDLQYLWNYETVRYSDGSKTTTEPRIMTMYAKDGSSITNIEELYAVTKDPIQPADDTFTKGVKVTDSTNRYLWNKQIITITHDDGTTKPEISYAIIGTHGLTGESGRTVSLTTPDLAFVYDAETSTRGSQTITWTATAYNTSGTVYYEFLVNGSSQVNSTKNSYGQAVPVDFTFMPVTVTVNVREGSKDGKIVATDHQTIFGVKAGYTPIKGVDYLDGKDKYVWIMFADDEYGNGITDKAEGKRYQGVAYNKDDSKPSNIKSDYIWLALYDNVIVGGRNLLHGSNVPIKNSLYNIARYDLTEDIKENEEVTLTIWGSLATTKSDFRSYNSGGSIHLAILIDNKDGTYSVTFKWKIGSSNNTYLNVYAFTNAQTGESRIDKIKLERGNVSTDWTLAPEDLDYQLEIISKDTLESTKRQAELEKTRADKIYNHLINVKDEDGKNTVTGAARTNLINAKNNLNNHHNTLLVRINETLAKDGPVSGTDKQQINTDYNSFMIAIADFDLRAQEAGSDRMNIVDKRVTEVESYTTADSIINRVTTQTEFLDNGSENPLYNLKSWKEEAESKMTDKQIWLAVKKTTEYQDSVDPEKIVNSINLTQEGVTIDANKINLNGAININSLDEDLLEGYKSTINTSMEDKTEILSDTEIYTDKADDSVVHVEIDGKSYQHAGSGKNLLPGMESGGLYSNTGNEYDTTSFIRSPYIPIKDSGEYIVSLNGSPISHWIYQYTDIGDFHSSAGYGKLSKFVVPEIKYIRILISTSNPNLKYQLEKGSTATEYELPALSPDYPIEIHSLDDFDVVSSAEKRNFFRPDLVSDITSYGSYIASVGNGMPLGFYMSVKKGETYTISRSENNNDIFRVSFTEEEPNKEGQVGTFGVISRPSDLVINSIEVPNNAKFMHIQLQSSAMGVPLEDLPNIKIEKGDISTDWTPAPENITEDTNHPLIDKINLLLSEPLRSVGDVKDRLFRDGDGLWKIERNVGEIILDGSEAGYSDMGVFRSYQRISFPNMPELKTRTLNVASSHFPMGGDTPEENSIYVHGSTQGYIGAGVSHALATNLNEFKQWLQKNNLNIYYELETPTIETLDQELQDKLNNLRSFKDSNYIYTIINDKTDIISENLNPTLHATFKGGGYYTRHIAQKDNETIRRLITIQEDTTYDDFDPHYYRDKYIDLSVSERKMAITVGINEPDMNEELEGILTTHVTSTIVEQSFLTDGTTYTRRGYMSSNSWDDWKNVSLALELIDIKYDGLHKQYLENRYKDTGVVAELDSKLQSNEAFWRNTFTASGGVNELRNSVGYAGLEFWTGSTPAPDIITVQDAELEIFGSGSGFVMQRGNIAGETILKQTVHSEAGHKYFSALINKIRGSGYIKITYDGGTLTIPLENQYNSEYHLYEKSFEIIGTKYEIMIVAGRSSELKLTNIMVNPGEERQAWGFAHDEVYGSTFNMNRNGLRVYREGTGRMEYTAMTPDEFAGYADVGGRSQKVFALNGETTIMKRANVQEEIRIGNISMIKVNAGDIQGLAFIRSGD